MMKSLYNTFLGDLIFFSFTCFPGIYATQAEDQEIKFQWEIISGGGGIISSAKFRLIENFNLPIFGNMQSESYNISGGFLTTTDMMPNFTAMRPTQYTLSQNYPNPFNPVTNIQFSLPEAARVILSIYNLLGQKLKVVIDSHLNAGYHSIIWDGTDENGIQASSGMYLFSIIIKSKNKIIYQDIKKMSLVK